MWETSVPAETTDEVWRLLADASFAVVSHVTPSGEPRSSGVLYGVCDRRLYVEVAQNSWKARHLAVNGAVAVTVPVRRGGVLSVVAPIPPATISFHGHATVHRRGDLAYQVACLIPPRDRRPGCVIEIVPEGDFVLHGIGVTSRWTREREASRARVPVADAR